VGRKKEREVLRLTWSHKHTFLQSSFRTSYEVSFCLSADPEGGGKERGGEGGSFLKRLPFLFYKQPKSSYCQGGPRLPAGGGTEGRKKKEKKKGREEEELSPPKTLLQIMPYPITIEGMEWTRADKRKRRKRKGKKGGKREYKSVARCLDSRQPFNSLH